MIGPYVASLASGAVAGMIVGDNLGAVATPAAVPATNASATPKATATGKPVSGGAMTPRQTVVLAAFYVVVALAVLLLGARVFKDARIG